ncbi:DUF2516 family protein [Rhodococcus sp. G-MC3]|uniref:DUF2516 family protein n=1 Tax=Rhodococcus sp. G-MC3 TaxID=3046209 RepID=UPI0024BA0011|nr:DUF2516 family protein [Rhodococcus sp. G-MC3]MDJ0395999.1 DUF2516 family protein [Rhodococcus sp. G-MC3]
MSGVSSVYAAQSMALLILQLISLVGAAIALFHALRQRSDAFPAAGKLTKPGWLGILGVATLTLLIGPQIMMLWIIGVVGVCVYLVDVRPKVDGIQRGPRW